jgi:DNA polymerase III delta prime subunit
VSSILIHGPGAEQRALQEALSAGHLVGNFGKDGLKVDDAREIVVLVNQPPFFPDGKSPVVIIGPLDKAQEKTQDVLLKTVEEPEGVLLILWAVDAGTVADTIQSRCLIYWAPETEQVVSPLEETAQAFLRHLAAGEKAEAIQLLSGYKTDDLEAFADVLGQVMVRDWTTYGKFWLPLRRSMMRQRATLMGFVEMVVA